MSPNQFFYHKYHTPTLPSFFTCFSCRECLLYWIFISWEQTVFFFLPTARIPLFHWKSYLKCNRQWSASKVVDSCDYVCRSAQQGKKLFSITWTRIKRDGGAVFLALKLIGFIFFLGVLRAVSGRVTKRGEFLTFYPQSHMVTKKKKKKRKMMLWLHQSQCWH